MSDTERIKELEKLLKRLREAYRNTVNDLHGAVERIDNLEREVKKLTESK